jgi:hypothetical protein
VVTPRCRNSVISAPAALLNEAGFPAASATCRARFSAITLLLSWSICWTMADSGGEDTLAMVAAWAGAWPAVYWVRAMPSCLSRPANASAATPAGSSDRGRRLYGSSESSGAPDFPSRPWSTSSELIGVTSPVLT